MYNTGLLCNHGSKVNGLARDKTTAGRYNNTEPGTVKHFQELWFVLLLISGHKVACLKELNGIFNHSVNICISKQNRCAFLQLYI